ncbi:Transcription factor IIS [Quillaja saponaria]|uniref:Transcription factor IIS n=1 Tax=Quillaja saponaria TaxID=32244 RepID=A0AAD7M160_QUISA|nr:Transcription factor IIS [Quillaja saponaria]KAJ7967171.1 Transcription factor IIS [Quillaja saponaria]
MMLEDFFTLTEMKDGLTAQSRVEELVMIMRKESSSVVKSFAEVARQWSAVAGALAATKSQDCLQFFVQLDGLLYLNIWLQEAQRCSDQSSLFAVEESLTALLEALEKLPTDHKQLKSSGIATTVSNLCSHNNPSIQDQARGLFSGWNPEVVIDSDKSSAETIGACSSERILASEIVAGDSGSTEPPAGKFSINEDSSGNQVMPAEVETSLPESLNISGCVDDNGDKNLKDKDMLNSSILDPGEEDLSTDPVVKTATIAALGSPMTGKGHTDSESLDVMKPPKLNNDFTASETVHGVSNSKETNHSASMITNEATSVFNEYSNSPKGLSSSEGNSNKYDSSFVGKEVSGEPNEPCDNNKSIKEVASGENFVCNDGMNLDTNSSDKNESRLDGAHKFEMRDSPLDLKNGANKTELEAGNNGREAFHACSEERTSKVEHRDGTGSISNETTANPSGASPQRIEEHLTQDNAGAESEDCRQEKSMVTGDAQELVNNSGKGMLDFDLNEGAVETDYPITSLCETISSPAVSKCMPSSGEHVGPSQVEGPVGLSGSSVTSTLEYPRRTPDGYGTVSAEGSCYSSKTRHNILEFDLNVTECDVNDANDTMLTEQIPASSGLPSGESSIEVSSRTAERLTLDLNCLADNDMHPAASTSSRQPSKVDFDLNENLSVDGDIHGPQSNLHQPSSKVMSSDGAFRQNDSSVFIMGARVEVDRDIYGPPSSNLPNVQNEDSATVTSWARPDSFANLPSAVPVAPLIGYNGFTLKPSLSPTAMYGPGAIPFVVDPRGTHGALQIMGSPVVIPPPFSSQPFLMGMNPAPIDGVGPSHAGFNLNSSLTMMEGANGGFGNLQPEMNRFVEGQWSTPQYPSAGMGLKRKEPDDGWELYPVNYKQQHVWR